jgi:hypothetical protein
MPQQTLQGKDIAAIAQVLNGKCVLKPMRVYSIYTSSFSNSFQET